MNNIKYAEMDLPALLVLVLLCVLLIACFFIQIMLCKKSRLVGLVIPILFWGYAIISMISDMVDKRIDFQITDFFINSIPALIYSFILLCYVIKKVKDKEIKKMNIQNLG